MITEIFIQGIPQDGCKDGKDSLTVFELSLDRFGFLIVLIFRNGEGAESAGINKDLHSVASPYRYLSWQAERSVSGQSSAISMMPSREHSPCTRDSSSFARIILIFLCSFMSTFSNGLKTPFSNITFITLDMIMLPQLIYDP